MTIALMIDFFSLNYSIYRLISLLTPDSYPASLVSFAAAYYSLRN
jgi:hypothetical protein